ncbi:type III pantothenate kinase [Iodidimonas muriae]|uniref:Type III pantothenate kinase n=1 Tax=Iodidimonas muriae TaxID=261467 RepID=A0ABQ2L7E4_9PROT|nr:type III pantothenate kinase [Iodidimonas muriae]GER08410.1 type III pantothenate kinase [Kordiimonadales bacterium JCM 17843]GGO05967.1 type III pantothenate kinase [Iodidimonas muriae]
MLLAIDQGNTNTVFALLDEEKIVRKWRISTEEKRTADEYMVWISALLKLSDMTVADIDGAVVATVVPQGKLNLVLLCRRYFKCDPLVVGDPKVDLGVDVRVHNPDEVGADRLVNAVAADKIYGGPLVIVDFGTATTFDVIGKDGAYLGGVISPGINLSLKALHEAAAKLPRIAVEAPTSDRVTGLSTLEAMQSGVFWGYVGLIDGINMRLRREHAPDMKVIATGGLAKIFYGRADSIDHVDHDLTISGMRLLFERNSHKCVPVLDED